MSHQSHVEKLNANYDTKLQNKSVEDENEEKAEIVEEKVLAKAKNEDNTIKLNKRATSRFKRCIKGMFCCKCSKVPLHQKIVKTD